MIDSKHRRLTGVAGGGDFHKAGDVDKGERFVHLAATVVAASEEDAVVPGDPNVGLRAVAAVEEDHLQALPVCIDHDHGRQGTDLVRRTTS